DIALVFFVLDLSPSPRAALSPYTTLFRSVGRDDGGAQRVYELPVLAPVHESEELREPPDLRGVSGREVPVVELPARGGQAARARSEEHTSELQSQSNLVCRLLLEKKKTQQ